MVSNRFVPGEVVALPGDTLRFINSAGGIHNIQFDADSISEPARRRLEAAMGGGKLKLDPISSPLLIQEGEEYRVEVPALEPGRYPFFCLPHVAGRMRGVLIVPR